MTIATIISNIVQYITEGFLKIFSPNQESYPEIGVQPFSGAISQYSTRFDW